jgi:hypothetical protein
LKNRNEVEERGAVVLMAETLDHEKSVTCAEILTKASEMMCQEIVKDLCAKLDEVITFDDTDMTVGSFVEA